MQFENLFSPIKIGNKTAKNRVISPSHGMPCLPFQEDFDDGSTYLAYQIARAKGGCGLIIVGPIICHGTGVIAGALPHGQSTPSLLLPKLEKLGKALHEYNALVMMQMYHHGDLFGGASDSTNLGWSANPINSALGRSEVPHEMTDAEFRYFHGLTCEKLNLFDQALEIYKEIEDERFAQLAKKRIGMITKETSAMHIRQIDPQVDKILSAAPARESYPQAGALILHCDEKIEVSQQDTQVAYLHYIVKILNERGKEDFAA